MLIKEILQVTWYHQAFLPSRKWPSTLFGVFSLSTNGKINKMLDRVSPLVTVTYFIFTENARTGWQFHCLLPYLKSFKTKCSKLLTKWLLVICILCRQQLHRQWYDISLNPVAIYLFPNNYVLKSKIFQSSHYVKKIILKIKIMYFRVSSGKKWLSY